MTLTTLIRTLVTSFTKDAKDVWGAIVAFVLASLVFVSAWGAVYAIWRRTKIQSKSK